MISQQSALYGLELAALMEEKDNNIQLRHGSILTMLLSNCMLSHNLSALVNMSFESAAEIIQSAHAGTVEVGYGESHDFPSMHDTLMEHAGAIGPIIEQRVSVVLDMVIPEIHELHAKLTDYVNSVSTSTIVGRSYDFLDVDKEIALFQNDDVLMRKLEGDVGGEELNPRMRLPGMDFISSSLVGAPLNLNESEIEYILTVFNTFDHGSSEPTYYKASNLYGAYKYFEYLSNNIHIPENNPEGYTIQLVTEFANSGLVKCLNRIKKYMDVVIEERASGSIFSGNHNKTLPFVTIVGSSIPVLNRPVIGVYYTNAKGMSENVLEALVGYIIDGVGYNELKEVKSNIDEAYITNAINMFTSAASSIAALRTNDDQDISYLDKPTQEIAKNFVISKGGASKSIWYELGYEYKHFDNISEVLFDMAKCVVCNHLYGDYDLSGVVNNLIRKQKSGIDAETAINEVVNEGIMNILLETFYIQEN